MSDNIRNLELIETELSNLDFDIDLEDFQYNLEQGITDFEINNYRFIHQGSIDEIQCNELESDEYILGCFTDWFLADVLELDIDVVQAMQKAEALFPQPDGLGTWLANPETSKQKIRSLKKLAINRYYNNL